MVVFRVLEERRGMNLVFFGGKFVFCYVDDMNDLG